MRKYKSFSDIPTRTEYLDVLQATLQRAQFNAKEMHWNVRGSGFKGIHEILDELYSKYDAYVDEIVETRMSNNDSFDIIITSFIVNSAISNYSVGECPFAKSLDDMTTILNLCLANQDDLYSDMIGRLTTDMNHYKYMVSGYQKHFQDGTLTDEVVITEEGPVVPTQAVINETLENSIPFNEVGQLRAFCDTPDKVRAYNNFVRSFGECPETGCVEKDGNGNWRVISNKTGKYWPQTYDSEDDAKDAIKAYHAQRGFSEVRNMCKTKHQMKAFNEFVKSFDE